jgi:TctA family transporter
MEVFDNVALGFSVAMTPMNLWYCFVGVLIGTAVGVLPGLGPIATIAMLLPLTFTLPPISALIMLAGIYYGAQYGGSTTAILLKLPGETASIVTCLDGNQMARQGRAGVALAVAAMGSFVAGTLVTALIAVCAPPLAQLALQFRPADYFSLMVLGLVAASVLASGSLLRAIGMILVGLLLGMVGTDVNSGVHRFAFDVGHFSEGINFVAIAMGLFGFAEAVNDISQGAKREVFTGKVGSLMPTREDITRCIAPVLRGTGLGALLGILPGGGSTLASFGSYALEKKLSKHPEQFGKGAIEGLAGPESANNAGAQASFIPMLTLGLPSNAVMALIIGALLVNGITPGPEVMTKQPQLFWGLIASMWIGNLMLIVLNLPLVSVWVKLISLPFRYLFPVIVLVCSIGVYSVNNSGIDVVVAAAFGVLGYVFIKLECEMAPLLLAFVLAPMMEENLRRAMTLSQGDAMVFLERPVSLGLLLAAAFLLALVLLPFIRSRREETFQEAT